MWAQIARNEVDRHWRRLFMGAAVSPLLGGGAKDNADTKRGSKPASRSFGVTSIVRCTDVIEAH
jgi:hypothetical protein